MRLQEFNNKNVKGLCTTDIFTINDLETLYLLHFLIVERFSNSHKQIKNKLLREIKKAQIKLQNYEISTWLRNDDKEVWIWI